MKKRNNFLFSLIYSLYSNFLEGIFLLSRGRTFRGSRYGKLIKSGTQLLRVRGRIRTEGGKVTVDYERSNKGSAMYENGKTVSRLRDMEGRFQVRVIGENAQHHLEGAPEIRRRFLDWNLFHVEPRYIDEAARFQRVCQQRNHWLRQGARGSAVWGKRGYRPHDS